MMTSEVSIIYYMNFVWDVSLGIYKKIYNSVSGESERIYLNKNGSTSQRATGEGLISELFVENGYQSLPLGGLGARQLLSLLKGCKSLVATSGTAAHQAMFMLDHQHCVSLNRSQHVHPLQTMINQMRGHEEDYVDVFLHSSNEHFGTMPCFLFPTDHFISYLEFKQFHFDLTAILRDPRLRVLSEDSAFQLDWLCRTNQIPYYDTLRKNQLVAAPK